MTRNDGNHCSEVIFFDVHVFSGGEFAEIDEDLGDQAGPAGLMAGAAAAARVAVKIFVEGDQVAPVWIVVEEWNWSRKQRDGHFHRGEIGLARRMASSWATVTQGHLFTRSGRALDFELCRRNTGGIVAEREGSNDSPASKRARANWSCRQIGRSWIRPAHSPGDIPVQLR